MLLKGEREKHGDLALRNQTAMDQLSLTEQKYAEMVFALKAEKDSCLDSMKELEIELRDSRVLVEHLNLQLKCVAEEQSSERSEFQAIQCWCWYWRCWYQCACRAFFPRGLSEC